MKKKIGAIETINVSVHNCCFFRSWILELEGAMTSEKRQQLRREREEQDIEMVRCYEDASGRTRVWLVWIGHGSRGHQEHPVFAERSPLSSFIMFGVFIWMLVTKIRKLIGVIGLHSLLHWTNYDLVELIFTYKKPTRLMMNQLSFVRTYWIMFMLQRVTWRPFVGMKNRFLRSLVQS
jgi:hypothetical protein